MKIIKYMILFIVSLLIASIFMVNSSGEAEGGFQTIPDEAIRLRILANSDADADQQLKYKVRDQVSAQISEWVEHIDDIEKARHLIASKVSELEKTVNRVLHEENSNQVVNIQYNSNVRFPMKVYDSFVYPPGEYEAVLITLGEGKGSNWWCVLFPPLCFLDFSNGATVAEAHDNEEEPEEDVKVTFFLFEWFGWS